MQAVYIEPPGAPEALIDGALCGIVGRTFDVTQAQAVMSGRGCFGTLVLWVF